MRIEIYGEPKTSHLLIGCPCMVATLGLVLAMIGGVGRGKPTFDVLIENRTSQTFRLGESVRFEGGVKDDWDMHVEPLLPGGAHKSQMFYGALGKPDVLYGVGFFGSDAPSKPLATIRLRGNDLRLLDQGRGKLIVAQGVGRVQASLRASP